ncbi:MAG: hypothetical protein JWN17_2468 [Frankiales bacterium]|nr:hypothetical protein [Frankiales bacterium]
MRTARLTAALVLGTAGLGVLPLTAFADTATTAPPAYEAWYQVNATCQTPAGCQAPPALPPAPALPVAPPVPVPGAPVVAGTLHIGVVAGTETARAVLGLPVGMTGVAPTSATLEIPLDVDPADASAAPETAKVLGCLTAAPLTDGEARVDAPPATNCGHVVALTYVARPEPHLQADLKPLLPFLRSATGLVLLPDRARLVPTEAWQAVFSTTHRGDSTKTPPAAFRFVVPAEQSAATPAVPDERPAAPAAAVGVPLLGTSAPIAVAEPELGGTTDAPPAAAPAVADQIPAVLAPVADTVALQKTIRVGYAYPGVWLLPLAMLIVVPLVGRALTADLTPSDRGIPTPPVHDQD